MPPEKIGRYEIKSELGRGGFATVYLAYDPRFEREVAIKFLPPELMHADPQFRTRFEREAKIIAQLEHPSIVPVYDVGEENNQPYFVMRYMGGGSLAERIKTKTFTVAEAVKLLEQIAPGMDEAHAKGIVHRDLKPANILFTSKGTPLISDFGIAKFSQGEAGNVTGSAIIGTPAYMAPEQASGEAVDGRTDIYALGVILYEMVTGKQPYQADTPLGLAIKHVTEPVPHILEADPSLPTWMEKVISTAMAKDKDDRFTTAVELVETIKAFLRGETPPERQSPTTIKVSPYNKTTVSKKPIESTQPAQKQRSWLPVLVIVGLLGVIVLGGGYFLLSSGMLQSNNEATIPSPTISSPAETSAPIVIEVTATSSGEVEPTATVESTQQTSSLPVIGGADKIAFVKSGDIWIMNVDGSELQAVTNDGVKKFNLQWLPDGKTILYMTGKSVKTVDIETLREEVIMSYQAAEFFDSFQVSPDGKQAAFAINRELFVVPYDIEKLRTATNRNHLLDMKGCIFYNELAVKSALWSDDGTRLAIKYLANKGGVRVDTIRIIDITQCDKSEPIRLDEFPLGRFDFNDAIENFSWDGDLLFFMNSPKRNGGFGDLLFYNSFTHKFEYFAPYEGNCCYRDATFSPDGTHVIFAFQDIRLATESPINLYYLPIDALSTRRVLEPLPLPDKFFNLRNDAPVPALRPAK
ncbi:MAG: protein kinase [Anaerolineales bacterium]|nr:protein kinase [Anaerolineales bacterium]